MTIAALVPSRMPLLECLSGEQGQPAGVLHRRSALRPHARPGMCVSALTTPASRSFATTLAMTGSQPREKSDLVPLANA
jgi:hypothetical protein